MKRSISIFGMALLLGVSGAAQAQISYSYAHAAGIDAEMDSALGEIDGTGAEVGLSYGILRRMHVFANYRLVELDDFSSSDAETLQAGVGYNAEISNRQSAYVQLSLLSRELDIASPLGTLSIDDDGYGLSVGYRETNNDRLEFLVSLDHVSFDDSDESDTSLFTSMQYRITRRFRIEGGVRFAGDDSAIKLGVRYYLPSLAERRD